MHSLLIVVGIFLVLRLLMLRRASNESKPWAQLLRSAVLFETKDWLVTVLALLLIFGILYSFALFFGPFKPIHEWFN
jgi:hypothetical protein